MTDPHQNLYLSSLNITTFKPFKFEESVRIEFPTEPSAVILCGHNGLGKSSTLEAIQWVLTGTTSRIERSNEKSANQYVSHCSPTGDQAAASASLVFHDPTHGFREIARGPGSSDQVADAFRFISTPEMGEAEFDAGREFLRRLELTHFLSQRAQARMAEAESDDLYERLTRVAGLDIYDHAARVILGIGTTRRHRAFIDQIDRKNRETGILNEGLSTFEIKKKSASVDGISPKTYRELVDTALKEICQQNDNLFLWQSLASPPKHELPDSDSENELLNASALNAQAISSWLSSADIQLSTFRDIAKQDETIAREITNTPQNEDFASVESVLKAQSKLQHEIDSLLDQIETLSVCIKLGNAIRSNATQLKVLEEGLRNDIEPAVRTAKKNLDKAQQLDLDRQTLRKSINRKTEQIDGANTLIKLGNEVRSLESALEELKNNEDYAENISDLERQSESCSRAVANAQQDLEKAQEHYETGRDRLSNLKSVIGNLLTLVTSDQDECPFCGHKHETAEDMRQHAENLLNSEESGLGDLASLTSAAESRLKNANAQYRIASTREERAKSLQMRIEQTNGKLAELRGEIESQNEALSVPSNFKGEYKQFIVACERELQELNNQFNELNSVDDSPPSLADAREAYERTQVHEAEQRQKISDINEFLQQDRGELSQLSEALGTNAKSLREFTDQLSKAENDLSSLRNRQTELHILRSLWDRRAANLKEWHEATQSQHLPDIDVIESVQRELNQKLKLKNKFDSNEIVWRDGVKGFLASEELKLARAALCKIVGQSELSDNELVEIARKRIAEIEFDVRRLTRTKNIAERISKKMERAGREARKNFFATDFADSLNDHLVALSPHRNLQVQLEPVTTQGGGKRLRLLSRGLQVSNSYSEGELAAVSLAAMLAAARKYRWSRWPALFLDDPIQHEDAIHQAAFADAMRNLIKYGKYQVFITTHDRGKAEYLQRKMKAYDELPCKVITYGKVGDRHVIDPTNVSSGDAAAKGAF